jgi:hypothetical protein
MTAPEPMTRTELMELAALDALGLLDEYEAALYTRSFHDAPAAVQNEIRELQAQIVVQLGELCAEKPSPELRDRVLKAVAKAIELDSPAPLASIGRELSDYDPRLDDESAGRTDDRRRMVFPRLALSGQFWRAASFLLLGVLAVAIYGLNEAKNANEMLLHAILTGDTADVMNKIGPPFSFYLSQSDSMRVTFQPIDQEFSESWANLWFAEATDEALLITEGLPILTPGETYQLRIRDDDGQSSVVLNFTAGMLLAGHRVTVDASTLLAAVTWEIAGPDGVVLQSTRA